MTKIMNFKHPILGCILAAAFIGAPASYAQTNNTAGSEYVSTSADFSRFTPRPSKRAKLDYSLMDQALSYIVLDLGPSLRKRAPKPQAITGSRRVTGHTSPYRMEGSRVTFDYINQAYIDGLREYREELEDVGTRLDVATLSQNEQLAYWFNLHNLAVLEKISAAYPIDTPSRIKVTVDGQKYKLHDAKFITVSGQKLSLRDIRQNIVYANWKNPNHMYGFYRGEIGSPKIQKSAFSATSIDYFLNDGAEEFVNSLRGFRKGNSNRYISELYQELDGFVFKNFNADLEKHLKLHANDKVLADVNSGRPFKFERYEDKISDLSGGQRLASSGNALKGSGVMSREIQRTFSEAAEKRRTLIGRGLIKQRTGYVIIEDLVPEEEKPTN